jgi:hypothetical protein
MTESHPGALPPRPPEKRSANARAGRIAGMLGLGLVAAAAALAGCGGTGMGAATRADITARMTSAQQPIEACYQAALKTNRKLQGMMVLSFAAAPSTGEFKDITVTRDELDDPAVRKCVIDEVSKLKLEKPQASRVAISYPLQFAPSN